MAWLATLICLAFLALLFLVVGSRGQLAALWREPVFKHPYLVFESDDWGAGPLEQAAALRAIGTVLSQFRDRHGRHPVMTLGIALAVADTEAIRLDPQGNYHRVELDSPRLAPVLEEIRQGMASGVFAPQLHGLEHYWPAAVMAAARSDAAIGAWLTSPDLPLTENLPPALQSRWTEGAKLPSSSLPASQIEAAVQEETALFRRTFGAPAEVVVPPTFVWNEIVERAWVRDCVRFIVTGGERVETRTVDGGLGEPTARFRNGETGANGATYLVRNAYFEPFRGHAGNRIVAAVTEHRCLGRPTLVETHRINYLGSESGRALAALSVGIEAALRIHPDLRFVATAEIAHAIVSRDPAFVESRLVQRAAVWLGRLGELPRIGRVARASGVSALAGALTRANRISA
jgi:hypothetical protein